MTKTFMKSGVEYTASNKRMRYNPEFHEKRGKEYTTSELIYMCSMWDAMKKADIAMALGRTHSSVLNKGQKLRESGEFDYYKKLGNIHSE